MNTDKIKDALLDMEAGSGFCIKRDNISFELSSKELFEAYEYQKDIFYEDFVEEYVSEEPAYDMLLAAGRLNIKKLATAVKNKAEKYNISDIAALEDVFKRNGEILDAYKIIKEVGGIAMPKQNTDEYCTAVTVDLMINKGYTLQQIKELAENNHADNKLGEVLKESLSSLEESEQQEIMEL